MRPTMIVSAVLCQMAVCQEARIPCLLPEDALGELGSTLSFEREFRTDYVRKALPDSGDTWAVALQYTWWNLGLYFFLPRTATAFGYDPSSARRVTGSQIAPIACNDSEDLITCLRRTVPPTNPRTPSGREASIADLGTGTVPVQRDPVPPVCSAEVSVPEWQPSPDSELKRYIIQKVKERLPIELPGKPRRVLMSDFNLDDPRVFVFAEVDTFDSGLQRLWLPATLNRRRIPEPVRLTRLGTSLVQPGDPVSILMRHAIQLIP